MNQQTTYQKVASHEAHKGTFNSCLLLYSGGLDTTVMLKWIQEEYECEVIGLTSNSGQKADNLDATKEKALPRGAKDVTGHDATDAFAELCPEAVIAKAD